MASPDIIPFGHEPNAYTINHTHFLRRFQLSECGSKFSSEFQEMKFQDQGSQACYKFKIKRETS